MVKILLVIISALFSVAAFTETLPTFYGLSTDTKPATGKYAGATYFETDTNRTWTWNAGWYLNSDSTYMGGTVHYSMFDANGRYQARGDSSLAWDEIFIKPIAVKLKNNQTKPDFGVWLPPFYETFLMDKAAAESLLVYAEIPHNHKTGDSLHVHVHWSPQDNGIGVVQWKFFYTIRDINGTFAFAAGDTISGRQASTGIVGKHQICDIGDIPMASITGVSAILHGVLIRDAAQGSDTYDNDAAFLDLGFHYRKDMYGSRWEFTK